MAAAGSTANGYRAGPGKHARGALRPSERGDEGQVVSDGRAGPQQCVCTLIPSAPWRLTYRWIYEINVYDLRRGVWSSKTIQPELRGMHSKGAYRSLLTGGKRRVIQPPKGEDVKASAPLSYSIEEEGEGGGMSYLEQH